MARHRSGTLPRSRSRCRSAGGRVDLASRLLLLWRRKGRRTRSTAGDETRRGRRQRQAKRAGGGREGWKGNGVWWWGAFVCSARGCLVLCCFQILFSRSPEKRFCLCFFGRAAGGRRSTLRVASFPYDHAPTPTPTRRAPRASARPAPTPVPVPRASFSLILPAPTTDQGENSWVGAAPRG